MEHLDDSTCEGQYRIRLIRQDFERDSKGMLYKNIANWITSTSDRRAEHSRPCLTKPYGQVIAMLQLGYDGDMGFRPLPMLDRSVPDVPAVA